jgi:hypothetical protein
MISESLNTIVELINVYISPASTDAPLLLTNISKYNDGNEFSTALNDKLILSIVNMEEDRVAKSPENYVKENASVRYKNPAIPINLTILFAATHTDYEQAIFLIEKVIRFFQRKNVFTPANTPELKTVNEVNNINIEKLIFDWVNLSLEQVNQLWTSLGGHYMPSVVMKMRMFSIDEYLIEKEEMPVKEIYGSYGRI